jgi:hypothetical protein
MPAGLNLRVNVWRFSNPLNSDDDIGGSVPTGTVIYANRPSRRIDRLLRSRKLPELDLDEWGLETERYNLFMFVPGTLDIRENDEVEMISPPNHPDYKKVFRVLTVAREGYAVGDPRSYLIASTRRKTEAHGIQ